jgi:hypothetical protein
VNVPARLRAGLVAGAALACAPVALGASTVPQPIAPDVQQTMPSVSPKHGGRHTAFTVSFTARTAAGGNGSVTASYIVMAVRHGTSTPTSCNATVSRDAGTTAVGQRVRVRLHAARRWCVGHYRATVVLNRQVNCQQPTGSPPVACPAIAFAPLDTGHAGFAVRSP